MAKKSCPLGDAKLAWSFNHDGEVKAKLLQQRDQALKVNTAEKRKQRQDLVPLAKPQYGVNTIANEFPGPIKSIPGVTDIANSR